MVDSLVEKIECTMKRQWFYKVLIPANNTIRLKNIVMQRKAHTIAVKGLSSPILSFQLILVE
ncbi:hypothetical protein STZ1_11214 [Bacillus subtilis]